MYDDDAVNVMMVMFQFANGVSYKPYFATFAQFAWAAGRRSRVSGSTGLSWPLCWSRRYYLFARQICWICAAPPWHFPAISRRADLPPDGVRFRVPIFALRRCLFVCVYAGHCWHRHRAALLAGLGPGVRARARWRYYFRVRLPARVRYLFRLVLRSASAIRCYALSRKSPPFQTVRRSETPRYAAIAAAILLARARPQFGRATRARRFIA